ncbi:hypothetical protein ACFXPA_38125 [Amycolatopsis sp. NPDC059090]|uniref:hypothetical protein n=1 Tax=Amycolatopsis sp. NPDC059090 TaxID=3346723 RepID=UPI0036720BF8
MNDLADCRCVHGIAEPSTVRACRPAEVEQVRAGLRFDRLPAQYGQFLPRNRLACGSAHGIGLSVGLARRQQQSGQPVLHTLDAERRIEEGRRGADPG